MSKDSPWHDSSYRQSLLSTSVCPAGTKGLSSRALATGGDAMDFFLIMLTSMNTQTKPNQAKQPRGHDCVNPVQVSYLLQR
jgi:hypothetical protein